MMRKTVGRPREVLLMEDDLLQARLAMEAIIAKFRRWLPFMAGLIIVIAGGIIAFALATRASENLVLFVTVLLVAALLGFQAAWWWGRRLERARDPLQRQEERRIEQRFFAAVEAAPTAMVMVNTAGEIVLVNAETETLFGYRREELLGRPVETLVPERFRAAHPAARAGFVACPRARRMGEGRDLFGLRKDGTEFPVEIGLNPVETDEGLFVLSAIVDITTQKRAEANLQSLNQQLEERVAERTRELEATLDELFRAKEAADQASAAKSAFLANMSHEIRTPLNAVLGLTELVLETPLRPQQRDYLKTVLESGESLLTIINDILDFSKIEAGRLVLENAVLNHAELLGDTMKSFGLRVTDKGLELLCRIAPEVPVLLAGDAGRLRQVLVNLVGNAVKFTERGEVAVEVEVDSATDDSVVLHYTVRDTGIGIPPGKLDRMFEPFEQIDASTTRRFGGTGLGLAICSRLVQLMGGNLWAESQDGRGSAFHFTARFRVSSEQPPAVPPASADTIRGLPVLIVDDNQTSRQLLQELVGNWGMAPSVAAGADEAMALLREAATAGRPIPLVITDAHMPDADGLELARRIKKYPNFSGAVIVMLSSGDRPGDPAACEELGVAAHLMKPIKPSELLDAVLLAIGDGWVEAREAMAPAESLPAIRALKILLAEDSLVNQKLALALLARHGHEVDVAATGREAMELWKRGHYDLVLMDVQMPELDGLEATKAIRAHERQTGGHTPVIALTAHAMKGDRERCLEAGMDEYVTKPIRRTELFRALARVLGDDAAEHAQETDEDELACVESSLIDWSAVLETAYGDEALLRDLVDTCLQETTKLLGEMRDAIDNEDPASLRRAAHTLKGQIRIFGAALAEHLALHIENTARDGSVRVAHAFVRLQQQIGHMHIELSDFLEGRIALP